MPPGTQQHILIAQPTGHPLTPPSGRKPEFLTADQITGFAIVFLPILFFASLSGRNAYQQRRDRILNQQRTDLERAWRTSYNPEQDR